MGAIISRYNRSSQPQPVSVSSTIITDDANTSPSVTGNTERRWPPSRNPHAQNGRKPSTATGSENWPRKSDKYAPNCWMNFSLKISVGTMASYWPRVTACMKPSHVRG